jgi:molecular chaperone DnaK
MTRQTIDFGIDLGATKSRVAVRSGTEVQIIKSTSDVPEGSTIEVTIECDASRNISARAYVLILDKECEAKFDFGDYEEAKNPEQLGPEVAAAERRFADLSKQARERGIASAQEIARRIEAEQVLGRAQAAAARAREDYDQAERCHRCLLELLAELDKLEESLA